MDTKKEFAARFQTAIPNVYQNILPREELEHILENTSKNEMAYLVAPFGYGKTFSVLSWLRKYNYKAVWLSMLKNNQSEEELLAYLTAGILSFSEKSGDSFEFLSCPEYREDPRSFLLRAALKPMRGRQKKILVMDDFHFITSAELLGFMKEFFTALLGTWRIVIISRAELHSVFYDFVLKKHVRFITIKELSFHKKEIAKYFLINRRDMDQKDIQRIQEETEGWPAALNAVLTVNNEKFVGSYEIFTSYISGFFESEIWGGLSDKIKVFLLKTSILDVLTPASCRAVTDESAPLPILKWLYGNGLFISKQNENEVYFYYHVFRKFLEEKRSACGIEVHKLYKRFGWWLFEQEKIEQSFFCFFKAGELYGISRVLKMLNPTDMGMEHFLKLTDCITQLNTEDLTLYPTIVSNMAFIYYLKGDIVKMQSMYQKLLDWNEAGMLTIRVEDYALYQWELGWLHYLNPDKQGWTNEGYLEWSNYKYYTPEIKKLHLGRVSILIFLSIFRGGRDYGDDGIFDVERVLEGMEKGEIDVPEQEEFVWNTYLIIAEYMYEIENFAKAEELVRRTMKLVEKRGYTYLYAVCIALLVKLIRAVYNVSEIDALIAGLEKMIIKNKDYYLLPNFHAFEQRNYLASGNTGFIEKFREENKDNEDKPYYFLLYRQITLVRVLLSTSDYNRAILILQNLTLLCNKYNRPTDLIEVNILKAVALYGLRFEEDACQSFLAAFKAAKRYGYIRIFSDEAKNIWPILNIIRKRISDHYLKKIIISCKKALARAGIYNHINHYSHLNLTKTEIAILKSLQADLSYNEIALDNDIRISTVKTHIHSIYSKLDVNNKTAAVIVAQKMGILDL